MFDPRCPLRILTQSQTGRSERSEMQQLPTKKKKEKKKRTPDGRAENTAATAATIEKQKINATTTTNASGPR